METVSAEVAAFQLLRSIRKEYSIRSWGKLARLRKFAPTNLYFPPEYSALFAHEATVFFFLGV